MGTITTPNLANLFVAFCTLALSVGIVAVGACAQSQPLSGPTTPTVVAPPTDNSQPQPEPPAPEASNAFSLDGYPGVALGAVVSEGTVAEAFAPMTVRAETITAEGEEVGKSFVVNDGERDIATLILDDDGSILAIRLFRGAIGPSNLEPGVTTYEQTRDTIGVRHCTGGAEEYGDLILCSTNTEELSVDFSDKTGKYYATTISDKDLDKILGNTVVEHVLIVK